MKVKGKFHVVGTEGGTVVVSALWSEGDVRNVICGIGGKDFCGLYTGQSPGQGAINSMAGM